MMAYRVRIRNNETGEVRVTHHDLTWHASSLFWWIDGNFGCDWNRGAEFQRAAGVPEADIVWECGNEKYTAIDATLDDGTVIPIDEIGAKDDN